MPIQRGKSNRAREANIKAEIAAGKPPAQAVAIGYAEQRRSRGTKAGDLDMGKKGSGKGIEMGHHGESSEGMGTDGGAPGSHEGVEQRAHQKQNRHIHTGHPGELERFHKTDENNH